MSTPVQGGRSLARFRVFGFPVHIDITWLLFAGLLGYSAETSIPQLIVWVVVATLAVLLHELGHAFAARRIGAQPSIALVMLGGVTTYTPPRQLSRLTSLGISIAGPAVGLVIGAILLVVDRNVEFYSSDLVAYAVQAGLFTTIGWSVLNLLPIIPLDGGQAMRELLPGDPVVRARRASVVSIVLAVGIAFFALLSPRLGLFAVVLALFFVLVNVAQLRALRPSAVEAARAQERGQVEGEEGAGTWVGGPASGDVEQQVVGLLWADRPADALALLQRSGGERPNPDIAVDGAVLAATGQREQGFALLFQEWERRPGDPKVTFLLALAHLLLHEWRDFARLLTGPSASAVPGPMISRAITTARTSGDEAGAADIERAARSRALP